MPNSELHPFTVDHRSVAEVCVCGYPIEDGRHVEADRIKRIGNVLRSTIRQAPDSPMDEFEAADDIYRRWE